MAVPGDVTGWINAGHDPSKVGLLLNTFGYFFIGADGLFQSWSQCLGHNGSMTVTQNSMLTGLLNVGGTLTWDAARQGSYISGTATAAYGSAEYGGVAKGQKFFAPLATPAVDQCRRVVLQDKDVRRKNPGRAFPVFADRGF